MEGFHFKDVKQGKDYNISLELAHNVGVFADAIKNKVPQPVSSNDILELI